MAPPNSLTTRPKRRRTTLTNTSSAVPETDQQQQSASDTNDEHHQHSQQQLQPETTLISGTRGHSPQQHLSPAGAGPLHQTSARRASAADVGLVTNAAEPFKQKHGDFVPTVKSPPPLPHQQQASSATVSSGYNHHVTGSAVASCRTRTHDVHDTNNNASSAGTSAPAMPSAAAAATGANIVYHRPTYRADLAKRGYLVRTPLGCGSYSKVKKVLNSCRNYERAAVKIVDRMHAPRDYQEKFMPRELTLWPLLRHPNLIQFLECFEESNRVYMVLEYAEGGDALHYVQATGAMPEDQAKCWVAQIMSAVTYMHELGLAHRDLKLENLLLSSDLKTIKICDFGFVRQIQHSVNEDLSRTFCGSKAYAAPEILQGREYDPKKADVWALGVIIYIFVTGKMPFDETKGTKSVVEEQRVLELKWLLHRKPSVACQSLIRRAFTWDFRYRPTSLEMRTDRWLLDAPWTEQAGSQRPTAGPTVAMRYYDDQHASPRSSVPSVPAEGVSYAFESVSMMDADIALASGGGDQPMESPRGNWVHD